MMSCMALPNESAGHLLRAEPAAAAEVETLFVGLVRDYHRIIYNYVFRLVGDDALAEDLTQESYLRAYRGLGHLPPGSNHRAWLFRIATNAATDELRRRKRRPRVPLLPSLGLRAPTESEDERLGRVCLDDALLRLAPHHRAVVNLFEFAELTAPEVGEVLGISPETARKRRQRAREALAKLLGGRRR
jgi:RNA polymerase sigma-70 factor, ECF subfamily